MPNAELKLLDSELYEVWNATRGGFAWIVDRTVNDCITVARHQNFIAVPTSTCAFGGELSCCSDRGVSFLLGTARLRRNNP